MENLGMIVERIFCTNSQGRLRGSLCIALMASSVGAEQELHRPYLRFVDYSTL